MRSLINFWFIKSQIQAFKNEHPSSVWRNVRMKLVMKNRSQNICFGDLVSRSIQDTTTKAIKFKLFQGDIS